MNKIHYFQLLLLCLVITHSLETLKINQYKSFPHQKNCYTQGIFFLNQTHLFQSCGLYNMSHYQVMKYQYDDTEIKLFQTFKSQTPIDRTVFLQGATYFAKTNSIYLLTWRQNKVYKVNRDSFSIQTIQTWKRDGWGLTNNQTHLFATDGGAIIYVLDQNFNIQEEKVIIDQNGRKLYNINELQYVVQNGKPYIYANVYMQRRIVKIEIQQSKVVKQFDLIKIIQNQKGLRRDQVLNGIAYHEKTAKFILTGKNWNNYYLVDLN